MNEQNETHEGITGRQNTDLQNKTGTKQGLRDNHDILCNKPDRMMVDKQLYCLHWTTDVELMDPHTHYVAGPADLLGEAWPGKLRQMSWAEESVQEEAQTGADPISQVWK